MTKKFPAHATRPPMHKPFASEKQKPHESAKQTREQLGKAVNFLSEMHAVQSGESTKQIKLASKPVETTAAVKIKGKP